MAFQTKDLSVLAYANQFTLWHYRTRDGGFGDGYFNPAHAMLRTGDIILANFEREGPQAAMLMVSSNDGEHVAVAALTGTGAP